MRALPVLLLAATLTTAATASADAGTVGNENGRFMWKSTECTEPTMPPSLRSLSSESSASDVNKVSEAYNAYSTNMQAYMNCVSKEAESDSSSVNMAIARDAQATIGSAQKKVSDLHDLMVAKQ